MSCNRALLTGGGVCAPPWTMWPIVGSECDAVHTRQLFTMWSFSTRCVTPSWHRTGSKTFGAIRQPFPLMVHDAFWHITSWNCSPVRRWEPSPGAALSCDFRTFQVYPKDLRGASGAS
jgi:hypothetical protein